MFEIEKNILNLPTLKEQTILITGSTGLIGSEIVNFLQYLNEKTNFNITIIATGRSLKKLEEKFEQKQNLVLQEINLYESMINVFEKYRPTYVIHAASGADPESFLSSPVEVMKGNFLGCLNLLHASISVDVKNFLYISSGEVYGDLDNSLSPFTESDFGLIDFNKVRSCYPESKRATETLCRSFDQQYGQKITIARPSHIFGAKFLPTDSRISATLFQRVINGKKIILNSKGLQFRSYTYISDCVSGLLSILINGETSECYNVTNTNNGIYLKDFAKKIADFGGVKFEVIEDNKDEPTLQNAVYSNDKLIKIGWNPTVDINEGIKRTFNELL